MLYTGWLHFVPGYEYISEGYYYMLDDEQRRFRLYSYKRNGRLDYEASPKQCTVQQRKNLNKNRASYIIRQKSSNRTTTKNVYSMIQAIMENYERLEKSYPPRIMPDFYDEHKQAEEANPFFKSALE